MRELKQIIDYLRKRAEQPGTPFEDMWNMQLSATVLEFNVLPKLK